MKKYIKRKRPSVPPQVEQDITGLINKMQQQLISLEKKIDTLIGQPSRIPFEGKHFSKPFRHFDHPRRQSEGKQDDSYRERTFTKAICADCNKECEVPFKPSGDRPVYCKECFSKRKSGSAFKEKSDNRHREGDFAQERHFDKYHGGHNMRRFGEKKKPNFRRRKEK